MAAYGGRHQVVATLLEKGAHVDAVIDKVGAAQGLCMLRCHLPVEDRQLMHDGFAHRIWLYVKLP
mgnify:CR=1 FL=1